MPICFGGSSKRILQEHHVVAWYGTTDLAFLWRLVLFLLFVRDGSKMMKIWIYDG